MPLKMSQWICDACGQEFLNESDLLAHLFESSCEKDLQDGQRNLTTRAADTGRDSDKQQYTIFKRCPFCAGTGGVEGENELLEKCGLCEGTGQILVKEINPTPPPRS